MEIVTQLIQEHKLLPNEGQIAGLPQNPRHIRDDKFEKLVKSIIDHTEMLHLRECIVTPYKKDFVILAGNMRKRAVKAVIDLSEEEFAEIIEQKQDLDNFNDWLHCISELRASKLIPCKIVPLNATLEQLRAYTVKDNLPYGDHDWDLLANEWDEQELKGWGLDLPKWDDLDEEDIPKPKQSFVKLIIEFDGDLSDYDTIKERIENIIHEFPSATLRN